jgi:2-iminobutanoate/2-iminopropanoate deaminase
MPDQTFSRTALLCAAVLAGACGCSAPAAPGAALPAQYFPSNVANAPFSAAVRVGEVVYLSGQIGIGADGKLPPDFTGQAQNTMDNVSAALKQAGLGFDDVFKCTVMLADMSHWEDFNKIYVGYFKAERLPARSAVGANGLARGALVELECLARARP